MFRIKVSEFALLDFEEAYYWYEEQRKGLGDDLGLCFDEGLEIISRHPYFEEREKEIRILNIRRFPYQIIYRITGEMIEVVAFFHGHRNPRVWQTRIE
ncbi:MAG: type II toxin-antitoxin system RelE/ParE family toxin [Bacteroidetes bacterium]|nr:type II toxin-antitoxin system RelE/ParE family toxin [Bacteroidota bacterium]